MNKFRTHFAFTAHGFTSYENLRFGDWILEGARLSAPPYSIFKDLRHGWEAVPLQNSDAERFSASCSGIEL
jgi:hypothetical protein